MRHENSLVEGLNHFSASTKSFSEIECEVDDQIAAFSLVKAVIHFVKHNDDVARFEADVLIAFAVKDDFLPVLHALLNMHVNVLLHSYLNISSSLLRHLQKWERTNMT